MAQFNVRYDLGTVQAFPLAHMPGTRGIFFDKLVIGNVDIIVFINIVRTETVVRSPITLTARDFICHFFCDVFHDIRGYPACV